VNLNNIPQHYVATYQEARQLIGDRERFWVSNCGCRERKGQCSRSRMDVCLQFSDDTVCSGTGRREISKEEAENLWVEAQKLNLVARPFRAESDPNTTDGVCFCCDDCCAYLLFRDEICDKGNFIEATEIEACSQCGICEDFCYFGARKMQEGSLVINRDECYGCGLCVANCPEDCIEMQLRN
jgi:NAD-dependent dihydropyrimidine dehydrogenase PreA subunit